MNVVPADNRGAPGKPRPRTPKFYVVTMRAAADGSPATSMMVRALTAQGAKTALIALLAAEIHARPATSEELLSAGKADARILDACGGVPSKPAALDPGSAAAEAVVAARAA